MVDTKLTPSRLRQTVVMKYERHAAYEKINVKTGKTWKNIKNKSRQHCTYHGMSLVSLLMLNLVDFLKQSSSKLTLHFLHIFLEFFLHKAHLDCFSAGSKK